MTPSPWHALASSALDVEREAARTEAARARLGQHREQLADEREQAGVRRGIRARRAADRRLIDLDDLVEQIDALDATCARPARRPPGTAAGASERYRMSFTSVDLPEPLTR